MLSMTFGAPNPPQALLNSLPPYPAPVLLPSLQPISALNVPENSPLPSDEKQKDSKLPELREILLERLDNHDCVEMIDSATRILCVDPVFTSNGKAHNLATLKEFWKETVKINRRFQDDVIPGEEKEVASKLKHPTCPKTRNNLGTFAYTPTANDLDDFVTLFVKNFKFIQNTLESDQLTLEFKKANEERKNLLHLIANLKDDTTVPKLFEEIKKFHDGLKLAEERVIECLKRIEFQHNFKEAYKLNQDAQTLQYWQRFSSTGCITQCLPSYESELVGVNGFQVPREVGNIITAANADYKSVNDFNEGVKKARQNEVTHYQSKMHNRKWYEKLFCCFTLSPPVQDVLNLIVPDYPTQKRK